MGNVTIYTSETQIYWPSDWLIDGTGATPESMGCPEITSQILNDETKPTMLTVIRDDYGSNAGRWVVMAGDGEVSERFIVMHSTNWKDVLQYFMDYMYRFETWLQEQE